jgi:hypothetical protein
MSNPIDFTMSCEQFAEALPDLLERDVDENGRARLEAHAVSCSECGPLLADLRKLRIDAANLPALVPNRDLWTGIAARIETPVVEITPSGGTVDSGGTVERWNGGTVDRSNGSNPHRRLGPLWIGLAAAGLVAITATITRELTRSTGGVSSPVSVTASTAPTAGRTPPAQSSGATPTTTDTVPPRSTVPPFHRSTASLASNKPTAEATFDAEIKQLRAIVAARRSTLDTTTLAVIEKNLKVIDDAIVQCREALRRDPASRFLIESLNDALDTKVQLLRTAALLPARS